MKLFVSHKAKLAAQTVEKRTIERRTAKAKSVPAETLEQAFRQRTDAAKETPGKVKEIGGPSGPEPTRYGDWERNGICSDF
ncbi:MAG: DUF1674 domain-containing protein [Rhodospirillales bacterium]|nr:DUF1674 domain-containing protein [Rhodospirillales bacterium]